MSTHEADKELEEVIARLEAERPVPSAPFRASLRREVLEFEVKRRSARVAMAATAGSGVSLLAAAAAGALGLGPLAA